MASVKTIVTANDRAAAEFEARNRFEGMFEISHVVVSRTEDEMVFECEVIAAEQSPVIKGWVFGKREEKE